MSRVKPHFKCGDLSEFSNYRPIAFLSSLSKIFEYVVLDKKFVCMCKNNLLTKLLLN